MTELYANSNAAGTLAGGGIDATTDPVTFSLQAGQGAQFPAPAAGDVYHLVCENEILRCTARTADSFTADRAQEGTAKAAHTAGASVTVRLTKASLEARALPSNVLAVQQFQTVAASQLFTADSGEAGVSWVAVNASSGPSFDAANKTQGTHSSTATLRVYLGSNPGRTACFYLNFSSLQAIPAGITSLSVDYRWDESGAATEWDFIEMFELWVADGPDLTGNLVKCGIPYVDRQNWKTFHAPLLGGGLAGVRSLGFQSIDVEDDPDAGTSSLCQLWLDNGRWGPSTEIEQALSLGTLVAIGPDYVPGISKGACRPSLAGHGIWDLRP